MRIPLDNPTDVRITGASIEWLKDQHDLNLNNGNGLFTEEEKTKLVPLFSKDELSEVEQARLEQGIEDIGVNRPRLVIGVAIAWRAVGKAMIEATEEEKPDCTRGRD